MSAIFSSIVWRVVVYMFVPVAFVIGILFMQQGMPMTYQASHQVFYLRAAAMGTADNGQPKRQTLVGGPSGCSHSDQDARH